MSNGLACLALACGLGSCMQFSPLETELSPSERDENARNIAAIEARDLGSALRFAVISDNHDDVDGIVLIGDALASVPNLAFVVHAGDLTETGLREEYRWALEALRTLPVPFVTTIGNHETLSHGDELYRDMFGPFDQAFRAGAYLFVSFDSNVLEHGHGVPDVQWIDETIAAHPDAAGVVLVTHRGLVHMPDPESKAAMMQVIEHAGVLALLHGHGHGLRYGRIAGRPVVETAGAQETRRFVLVSISGTSLSFEVCSLASCEGFAP